MAGPWWVVAIGRGTSLTASVQGPSATAPTPGFAGASFNIVGAQQGYPSKPVATEAAGIYNAGGLLPNDPSQAAVNAARATEPAGGKFSPQGNTNRVQQAGGTVGSTGPLGAAWNAATAIPRFLSMLTNPNLWLRVGEVVAGMILLGIGVNALFKGKPMAVVTDTAGKVAKAVPMAAAVAA